MRDDGEEEEKERFTKSWKKSSARKVKAFAEVCWRSGRHPEQPEKSPRSFWARRQRALEDMWSWSMKLVKMVDDSGEISDHTPEGPFSVKNVNVE